MRYIDASMVDYPDWFFEENLKEKEMAYEVEFSYKIVEGGSTVVDATTKEEAEDFGYEYVRDTYPEAYDIEIEAIREVK